MTIEALHHVQLAMPVGRESEAVAFYEGVLEIPQIEKPPHLAARGRAWFERGELRVHLGVDEDFRPAFKAHAAFLVDDLDSLERRLADHGHEAVRDQPLPGYRRFYASDPFGNRLEFLQPEG